MLQRIQSLYLFLAIFLNAIIFNLDLAQLSFGEIYHNFTLTEGLVDTDSGVQLYSAMPLTIICFLSMLTSLIIIFMYKRRRLQIKLSQLNLFLQAGFVVAIFLMIDSAAKELKLGEEVMIEYGAGTFISIVPMLFIYLAIRAIKKDEALVKAADRIR